MIIKNSVKLENCKGKLSLVLPPTCFWEQQAPSRYQGFSFVVIHLVGAYSHQIPHLVNWIDLPEL